MSIQIFSYIIGWSCVNELFSCLFKHCLLTCIIMQSLQSLTMMQGRGHIGQGRCLYYKMDSSMLFISPRHYIETWRKEHSATVHSLTMHSLSSHIICSVFNFFLNQNTQYNRLLQIWRWNTSDILAKFKYTFLLMFNSLQMAWEKYSLTRLTAQD